jgi:hypothetical protein
VRVTFTPADGQKLTFNVRGHAADMAVAAPDSGDEDKQ